MLKSPRLGMKNATIDKILFAVAIVPQKNIEILAVKGKNPFSKAIVLRWSKVKVCKLQMIENVRTTSIGNPKIVSFLKTSFKPPVVKVPGLERKTKMICPNNW